MVVEGEVVAGHVVDAQLTLASPSVGAKRRGRREQGRGVCLARPVVFERALQFAARADAGKAQGGDGDGHCSKASAGVMARG
jgi:hypothetical protein